MFITCTCETFHRTELAPSSSKCSVVTGSVFEDPIPKSDVFGAKSTGMVRIFIETPRHWRRLGKSGFLKWNLDPQQINKYLLGNCRSGFQHQFVHYGQPSICSLTVLTDNLITSSTLIADFGRNKAETEKTYHSVSVSSPYN